MATFTSAIENIQQLSSASEKTRILVVILNSFQNKKVKITTEDKKKIYLPVIDGVIGDVDLENKRIYVKKKEGT